MHKYTLKGKIIPKSRKLTFPNKIEFGFQYPGIDDLARVSISIENSEVEVVVKTEGKIDDYHTLRNYIRSNIVSICIDCCSYLAGEGFKVYISSLITDDGEEIEFDNYAISRLQEDREERLKKLADIFNEVLTRGKQKEAHQLRLAVANFNKAITNSEDTGFHCYRSIEAIRQVFDPNPEDVDWVKFNNELGFDQDMIDWFKDLANDHATLQRHGRSTRMTGEDREEMIAKTQKVIDRFVEWVLGEDVFS